MRRGATQLNFDDRDHRDRAIRDALDRIIRAWGPAGAKSLSRLKVEVRQAAPPSEDFSFLDEPEEAVIADYMDALKTFHRVAGAYGAFWEPEKDTRPKKAQVVEILIDRQALVRYRR